jgi:5'-methylthioadenosine phosphorylase
VSATPRWCSCPATGAAHRVPPSDINYRANIDAFKRMGVTDIVSLSACGSFKEELPPGAFVLVDQFVDRTHRRESSFFGRGCVAHVSMAHPVGPRLQERIAAAAAGEGIPVVRGRHLRLHGGAPVLEPRRIRSPTGASATT